MRPALPLPPADEGTRVPGMLLIRTDHDDDAWRDVLHRMGELPGLVTPRPGDGGLAPTEEEIIPRRLVVVDDPAWRGAAPEEVREALGGDGAWVPDLVLMATERTAATPHLRPLRAFRGDGDGDVVLFRITPLQAALAYLVLHLDLDITFEYFEEWSPIAAEWEPEEGEDLDEWEAGLPDPVGAYLERLDPVPRYTRPAQALPLLTQGDTDLIVRTDFSDDAAWETLLETVYRPGGGGPIDDFGDYIDVVDDPVFEGAAPEQVMAVLREWGEVLLIADGDTMRDPGHRVLAVPLEGRIGCAFRLDPDQVGSMVANLSIGNQDIEDYMDDETLKAVEGRTW
ncbi:DUF6924 domain-containing protein [Actinoallomurus iriomotensis]|uniref:DUF6924 domain-containing protein n=1 Tax=Actinoallomurus iriomotensis TaxID=478107 RepID=A0A9W6VMD8_9ACTN|nr:hypothetical protein [Actinoallomurus iriomotensis]GLY72367.1 hypothetical protein Airi01_006340 [Actinoallomurus iriomotensis]